MLEVVGCYTVPESPEPCYLLEVVVSDSEGFDIAAITQEEPGQPRKNWQVPYDERLLNQSGDTDQRASWPIRAEDLIGNVRLAFFMHYLDLERPLATPFGDVRIPEPKERPGRLKWLVYEEP